MKYLKSYKLFEERNYKVMPEEIWSGAIRELRGEGKFDNIDELFGFYDYWLTIGDSELPYYDPVVVKERLESFYSSPPTADEEWFPMFTFDEDTVEWIMNELSGLYADYSFKAGEYRCGNCHNIFRQTNRHQTMCSSSCENEYSEKMSDWR